MLNVVFVLVAASLGFVMGCWFSAMVRQEECFECRREMWTAINLDKQQSEYKNYCEGYCFDCAHYDGTMDYGKCNLCNGYVEATDYCLSWEAKRHEL